MNVLQIVVTAMLGACGGAIFTWIGIGARKLASVTKVIKALSHDALFNRCEALILKGSISKSELENLDMLWDAYSGLGMNGAGSELYNRAKGLPLER